MVDMDNPAALNPLAPGQPAIPPPGGADKDAPLKEDIRLLGRLLGDVLRDQEGEAVFDVVETIRQTAVRFRREDDSAAVIRDRLKVFTNQTSPLVDYYRDRPTFSLINGLQHLDKVTADLLSAIESAMAIGRTGTRDRARA